MLNASKTYCKHAKPVQVTVPVKSAGTVSYYTRFIMSPCGECEHCRRKKQNEWSSRLYYAGRKLYKNYPNGFAFFCTFTISNEWFIKHYNELYEIFLNDPIENGRKNNIKDRECDIPTDIQDGRRIDIDSDTLEPVGVGIDGVDDLVDRIQVTRVAKYIYNQYWKKKLLDFMRLSADKRGVGLKDMKYYTCCEFGDRTERIHFHTIFFIPDFTPIKQYCYRAHIKIKRPFYIKGKNCANGQKRLSTLEERIMESFLDYLWSDSISVVDNVTGKKNRVRTPIGFTNVNKACAKSFRYITKYVCKLKEDKECDKIPFHRQSQEIGLNIDAICHALSENQPYYVISCLSKEYKVPISKYYRKKYAILLGIDDQFNESFIANANRLFLEHAKAIGYDERPVISSRDNNSDFIDALQHDLVRVVNVEYITRHCWTRESYSWIDPSTGEKKKDYRWVLRPRMLPIIFAEQMYLDGLPYERKQTVKPEPNETY